MNSLTTPGTIDVRLFIQPIAMTCYYPTLSIIAAAGFSSFRELYRNISSQGCQDDEYYTITYIDTRGLIRQLIVPVWKVLYNSLLEVSKFRKRRR
ncbi:MAG TPA: hypothetical protein VMI12_06070 [Puia sp.]|nr:hypothetical protein [Puia sp.]